MLNRVLLIGRLTRDPEIRYIQGEHPQAGAHFSLAVDRNYKKKDGKRDTDFFELVAWRQKAEFVSKYFKKGQQVCVEGRLQRENWTDKDDIKRTTYRIVVENCYFCDSKKT
jgi:single-strand DNA-binding protein